ncbi:hypothetical protein [uncultured Brevibacillus sp.]|uniref:hypothetical protein n=1 Tax=uncultured Brevibacillus sp. TaxID=169970 RepID=UPI0025952E46|nr:hypothetical protein [uncultured Brevibacillus sp.]
MSGEKRNNVTVKMNGKFWEEKREDSTDKQIPKELPPRVRIQAPPISIPGPIHVKKGNDAMDRMKQLRERGERETPREAQIPDFIEQHEEINQEIHHDVFEEKRFGKMKVSQLFSYFPKGPVLQTVLTTGGAIAVGLLFGFLVLTVFTKEEFSESYRTVLEDTVQTLTAASPATDDQKLAGPILPGEAGSVGGATPATSPSAGNASEIPLQLPQINMFVAQAGVFQKDAAPDALAQPLDKMGIPHLVYKDSAKQYMFAAAAPTRDAVLGFATSLKNKGMDVYVKEFAFPAFQGTLPVAPTSGAAPDVSGFFSKGVKLIQTLSSHSGLIITTGQLSSSPQETATLKEQHRQFLESSRLVQVPEAMKKQYTAMVNGIDQAMAAREKMVEASAGKKIESAESYAWQVQAGVLEYLEGYANLLQQAQKKE